MHVKVTFHNYKDYSRFGSVSTDYILASNLKLLAGKELERAMHQFETGEWVRPDEY